AGALGASFTHAMIAIALTWWPWYTRVVRAQTLSLRERYFIEAARSIGYVAREKSSAKISRWQKIALEAARSSHGAYIPQVAPVASFEEMLCAAPDRCVKLIFWEEESRNTIKDVLSQECLPPAGDFFVIVGPEGGFSREEISQAIQKGFQPVSMGKQILKVETAAAAILTIIQYEKGIFSHSSKEAKP
ncbi:MAG TPA: RsmE family RNA methyltransferase, partial [Smithella sp.]|nr:RsmE family RNA methyltransferase [Smithella sp.]